MALDEEFIDEFLRESNKIENVHKKDINFDKAMSDSWEAYEYLSSQDEIGHEEVKKVHELILQRLQPEIAGKYREQQNYIGGHVPPSPSQVTPEMGRLLQDQPESKEEALEWHLRFEKIHPHLDGNGRVGRVIYLVQCENLGVEPELWTYEDRREYYKLFRQDRGQVETQTQEH